MKKITMAFVLAAVLGTGAFAETNTDMGYLGVGWVAITPGGDVIIPDNPKVNFFLGWGSQLLAPLPIWVGFEGLVGLQKIGENSQVAYSYNEILAYDPYYDSWTYSAYLNQKELKTTYWDVDLSPRLTATLDLDPLPVYATVYAGLNWNKITMDWVYTDSFSGTTQEGTENIKSNPVQAITGLRVNAWFLFAEFERFFNFENGEANFSTIAENRLSLGLALKF